MNKAPSFCFPDPSLSTCQAHVAFSFVHDHEFASAWDIGSGVAGVWSPVHGVQWMSVHDMVSHSLLPVFALVSYKFAGPRYDLQTQSPRVFAKCCWIDVYGLDGWYSCSTLPHRVSIFEGLNVATLTRTCRWEAAPFTSVSFPVPDNWKAGRIWVSSARSKWRKTQTDRCIRVAETATSRSRTAQRA